MPQSVRDIQAQQDRLAEMLTPEGRYKCDDPDCHARKPYITLAR